jgi:HSP20 family protein
MADIVRRDPFELLGEFAGMRRAMDRLFDENFRWPGANGLSEEGTLPIDVLEHDGKVVVRASLPGFKKEDIDVQLHEGVLSIKAEHTEETQEQGDRWYRRERRTGSVSRRIALPGIVAEADVTAELKDGVLTLSVPTPEKPGPKQIEISAA